MAAYADIYMKLETLETLVKTLQKKGEKGISLTVAINDESKEFKTKDGKSIFQNVSAWVSQTKEQREEKKDRYYVANGKVFWNNGEIKNADSEAEAEPAETVKDEPDSGLPF
jgi:hypothetical protein